MQAVCAVAAIGLLSRVPEVYTPHLQRKRRSRWIPSILVAPGISVGFVNVHYPVVAGFLILHLQQSGTAGPMAFSAYAIMVLLSRFFLGGLPDRIPPAYTFYGGITAMSIGLLLLASGPSGALAVGSSALLGLGFSFPWSAVATTVLKEIPDNERGSAVGVLSAFYDLFVGVSSFAAGMVARRYGYPAAFTMSAAALIAAGVAGRYVFRSRTSATDVASNIPNAA
jgi:MFS family permease